MELNRKLAEWAGFETLVKPLWEKTETHRRGTRVRYVYPDGGRMALLPPFTTSLDAIFKWLEPKVKAHLNANSKFYEFMGDWLAQWVFGEGRETPRMKLCLEIEKLIDGEANGTE